MEKIEVNVLRICSYRREGFIEKVESAFSVPGLDRNLIREQLLQQAEEFSGDEIIDGRSLGGIYVDPETGSWMNVLEHTDRASETIGESSTADEISQYLFSKFTNVSHAFSGLEHEPVNVTLI